MVATPISRNQFIIVSDHIKTPFSESQVKKLNEWQHRMDCHPFTCGGNRSNEAHVAYQKVFGGDLGQLVATAEGWVCPVCGYKQNWAHGFMSEE